MRIVAIASGIVLGLIAATGLASACSYCGDPDLLAGGPSAGPTPILTPEDEHEGFYLINKGFTGNTVTTTGDTTTYGFTTVDVAQPVTIGRDVAVVGTGQTSFADGTSSNLRPTLSDGRPVAGTYVDSFKIDANGNKVWFDRTFLPDDSQTQTGNASAPPTDGSSAPPAAPAPDPAQAPVPEVGPSQAPTPPAPDTTSPSPYDGTPPEPVPAELIPSAGGGAELEPDAPVERETRPSETGGDTPGRPSTPDPRGREIRAGISLGPQADVLSRIEILRGRAVRLWIRATVNGSPARVLAWRLVSGDVIALGPVAGSGDEPFVAQWLDVGHPGDVFALRFDALVDTGGGAAARVPATIDVTVRSPAIVE